MLKVQATRRLKTEAIPPVLRQASIDMKAVRYNVLLADEKCLQVSVNVSKNCGQAVEVFNQISTLFHCSSESVSD